MHLERYLLWGQGEPFAKACTVYDSRLFTWYLAQGKVGISTRMIKGAPAGFTYGFLTWGDTLVVRRTGDAVELWRDCYPKGVLSEKNGAGHHVAELADLLQSRDAIHVFETYLSEGGVPNVLAFSVQPPLLRTYQKVEPMALLIQ